VLLTWHYRQKVHSNPLRRILFIFFCFYFGAIFGERIARKGKIVKRQSGIWSKSVKNMGSITSSGPKRISKTPIVSLQSHRRRDDLIKRLVMIHLLVSKRLTFSSYLNKK
jgi:hypothetical protein